MTIKQILVPNFNEGFENEQYVTIGTTNIGLMITALCLIAYISPVKQAYYLMSKKSLDNCYSLPISRRNIMIIKVLTGIIETLVPFTLIYIIETILLELKFPYLHIGYTIPLYFILIVSFISLYIFNFFFISRANKIFDGIVFMIFANFSIFILLFVVIGKFYPIGRVRNLMEISIPFWSFGRYGNYFNNLILTKYNPITGTILPKYNNVDEFNPNCLICLVILALLSAVGLWFLFKKDRPERSEEISDSYFGYRVMIPFYTFSYMLCTFTRYLNFLSVTVGVGIIIYLILTIIYKRSFKISLKDWMIFGIIFVAVLIVGLVFLAI